MGPPHPQTAADREALAALFPSLPHFPKDFEFPIVQDPNYKPQADITYVLVTASVCFLITSSLVLMRLWIRYRSKFGMDDWVVMLAYASYVTFGLINIVGCASTGLGYHLYDLSILDINSALLIEFLHSIFWTLSLHLTRISILYLLLRITENNCRAARFYLHTVVIVSYLFILANVFFIIFQCQPVTAGWNIFHRSSCLGTTRLLPYGILCAGHVFLDLLTVVPPIPVIITLKISMRKKMNLALLLVLGFITIILTSVRMFYYYRKLVDGYDLTRDLIPVGFYGILECSIALTVACLPALNHFVLAGVSRARDLRSKASRSDVDTSLPSSSHKRYIHLGHNKIYRGPMENTGYSADATANGSRGSNSDGMDTMTDIEMARRESKTEITVEKVIRITTHDIEMIGHAM